MPVKPFLWVNGYATAAGTPDRQKRLFNRKYARFNTSAVHEDVELTAGALLLH